MFGLAAGHPHADQIFERMRFTHHAVYFRYLMGLILIKGNYDLLPDDILILQEGVAWLGAFFQLRRVQLRGAGSDLRWYERPDIRNSDLHVLLILLKDRIFHIEATTHMAGIVPEPERRHVESLWIAKNVMASCESLVELLLRYADHADRFSASLSFYITTTRARFCTALRDVFLFGEAAFQALSPDHRLAFDVGEFMFYRFMEVAPDEPEQQLPGDHGRIANCGIWIDEMNLVLREIETEHNFLPVEDIAEHTNQLSAILPLLQRAVHRTALMLNNPREQISLYQLEELESRYNELVKGDSGAWPGVGGLTPRPVYFELLLRMEYLLGFHGMHPKEVMPDAQDEPKLHDWRHVRILCRKLQHDALVTRGPPEPLQMLESLRTLLFIVARGRDWPNVYDSTGYQLLQRYNHFQAQLAMCIQDEQQNPPDLWFPPWRQHQEVRRLAHNMTQAVLALPWMGLAMTGVLPPERPDDETDFRPMREWYNDLAFAYNVHERFVMHGQRATIQAWTLDAAKRLLLTIFEMRYFTPEDRMANDERVAAMQDARTALLNNGGRAWHPLVTERDEVLRLANVFGRVVAVMQRHFPPA